MRKLVIITAILLILTVSPSYSQLKFNPFTNNMDFTGSGLTSSNLLGTANQITVSCSVGICTLSLPTGLIFPGTVTFAAGTTSISSFRVPSGVAKTTPVAGDLWNLSGTTLQYYDGTSVRTIQASNPSYSGTAVLSGLTSGAAGFGVLDVAGTAILYLLPSANGTAGKFLYDSGAVTCPTTDPSAPAVCHQLLWSTATIDAGGIFTSANFVTTNNFTLPSGGYLATTGLSLLTAPSDGIWKMTNNANNSFNRLQLGGTTSSFPSLQRSSTGIIVRLADDSANAPLTASTILGSTSITDSGLTATRVTFAGAAGLLADDSDLTFVTDTLTATKLVTTSLLSSGLVDGQAPVDVTTGATANLGGTYNSGYTINQEATAGTGVTYTLPATVKGKQYCVKNGDVTGTARTGVLTVAVAASSYLHLNGARGTISSNITSGGAAGDAACFVAIDATNWEVYVNVGTWTLH